MRGGSSCSLNISCRFLVRLTQRTNRLLLRIGRTLKPTCSGTGSSALASSYYAHALGQVLPRIRPLLKALHHGSQARFRTLPDRLGDAGLIFSRIKIGQQEGGIQVPLHGPQSTWARMPALRPGLLVILSALMTILRQSGLERGDLGEGAASFRN